MSRVRGKIGPGALVVGGLLLLAMALQLIPFYIAVTTSLKDRADLSSQWAFPGANLVWKNFGTALRDGNILTALVNSVIVAGISTVLICLVGALAAYPLARNRTRLNRIILLLNIGMIMIPPLSILVPLYSLMYRIGGLNTYWGEIVIMVTTELPFSIFLYTNFMRSLPESVEEAAALDGAGTLRRVFSVVFPMLKPVTATVIILTSMRVWNEYALSGYILSDRPMQTIAPAVASFFSSQVSNLGAASAAALLAALPMLAIYLFLQKYFIKGMVAGSEK